MQNYYSFCGTKLHLLLEDEIAEGYNKVAEELSKVDPTTLPEHIQIMVEPSAMAGYDKVARVVNLLIEVNDGALEIYEKDMTSNMLIKL